MIPWTAQEDATLLAMAGNPHKVIARRIPRSPRAISFRLLQVHGYNTVVMRPRMAALPTVTISKQEVVRAYELGWRFAGFDSELCKMEWRGKGRPAWGARA